MKLVILLLLTGCASYAWRYDGQVTDFYRWKVVSRAEFPHVCGFVAPDGWNSGGACAIRVQNGMITPTDKRLATGEPYGKDGVGRVCIIVGTMSEEEAKRMRDWDGAMSLRDHEIRHCGGWIHDKG